MPTWGGPVKAQDACEGDVNALESNAMRESEQRHFAFSLCALASPSSLRSAGTRPGKGWRQDCPTETSLPGQELKCLAPLRLPSAPTHHSESFWFALFFQSTRFLGFGRALRLSVWELFLGCLSFSKPPYKSLNFKIRSLFSYRHNNETVTIILWDCSYVHLWCLLSYLDSNPVPAAP